MTRHSVIPALLCLLLSAYATAQSGDVPGSSDSDLIQRFRSSTIVDFQQQASANYMLVLGRMQRINGRVVPSASERLQGNLSRITYSIPAAFSADEVFDYFRGQLLAGGNEALYTCQGRACGSSNFWANEVFSNRILYGPEANQYYLAANQNTAEGDTAYVAVYVITRANRRVYAHLDILEPANGEEGVSATPEAVLQRLQRTGSVILEDIEFDAADALINRTGIDLAIGVLRRDPLLNVYVVGHLQASGTLDEQVQRSEARAARVREALLEAGIDSGRVIARGVGPLAPACSRDPCEQRIELVLQ